MFFDLQKVQALNHKKAQRTKKEVFIQRSNFDTHGEFCQNCNISIGDPSSKS